MILVIDRNSDDASTICTTLHCFGILCCATAPGGALSELSRGIRSVLITDSNLGDYEELVRSLRAYSVEVPIFALIKNHSCDEKSSALYFFDKVFRYDGYLSTLVSDIVGYQREHKLAVLGEYKLAGIDASVYNNEVSVFDKYINLTKTELMVLRYLISSYPVPAKASNVLRYAFMASRLPDITNVRTHISVINSKFTAAFGSPIIKTEPRIGYTVITPELAELK